MNPSTGRTPQQHFVPSTFPLWVQTLEQIRTKPSHQRSLEEKQWVALDILINKDLYRELSAVENEELQLNDEYKTQLKAEDVKRILGLPPEIQLALPHMKSAAEVDAHRLLTTYTLEHGDAEFAKADEQSQDHLFPVSFGAVRFARNRCSPSAIPRSLVHTRNTFFDVDGYGNQNQTVRVNEGRRYRIRYW